MAHTPQVNEFAAKIVTLVSSVDGIDSSQVHDGDRDIFNPATSEQLFWDSTNDRFSGWAVTWRSATNFGSPEGATRYVRHRDHHFIVKGWSQTDDSQEGQTMTSEPAWRMLVELVCQEIGNDLYTSTPLGNSFCVGGSFPEVLFNEQRDVPLAGEEFEDGSAIRCHYCELSFLVRERAIS